jgi:hypothetical protein
MASPALGMEPGLAGKRCSRIEGVPLTIWYFEPDAHLDVARRPGQRQNVLTIDLN